MRILREHDYVTVPWKNGGGITREILKAPSDAASFDWRLSLATIAAPGPFSAFDGYQRTLVLVRGAGVELDFGPHGRIRLDAPGQSAFFDGSWPTRCELIDGPSTDLNLIVAKDRTESRASVLSIGAAERITTAGWDETLICCISGSLRLESARGGRVTLHSVDVARCSPDEGPILCEPHGSGPVQVLLAFLRRVGSI
ncbi:MAG TPA: HutD family protein [Steroidobacteraceae bacterium]|nr:HutD family protein [Steroidobacteraceae bacterium]